jgi:hypothetical protein
VRKPACQSAYGRSAKRVFSGSHQRRRQTARIDCGGAWSGRNLRTGDRAHAHSSAERWPRIDHQFVGPLNPHLPRKQPSWSDYAVSSITLVCRSKALFDLPRRFSCRDSELNDLSR